MYSRQATASVNCENSAVSFVMKYCPISTTFRNPAYIQNLTNLSCCDKFSIRSPNTSKKNFPNQLFSLHRSEPKGWIRGNTKIGPVLEVATCCLHGKYGVEIRTMSMNKDNSHSWVRISYGSNKLVTNLNNNEQETSEVQFEEYALN